MARQGVKGRGARRAIAPTIAKAPQKKTKTAAETQIFSARRKPRTFPSRLRLASNSILFHWFASHRPGAWPRSIDCASHALYVWLPRSPASILLCQKQGTSTAAEVASTPSQLCCRNRAPEASAEVEGD